MAREWSLLETKALVEEHIAVKEEEKAEVRTASEHWNKVAKKLREKGINRSHKSCNKRWYRLEQYEVQIFSFNMEEGNKKNFWDLTKAERLEFRDKWPHLPLGDGIDRDIFDALKQLSHRCEKKEVVYETPDKEVILAGAPETENTRPPQPQPQPQPLMVPATPATPRPTTAPFSTHPMVTGSEQSKPSMWPVLHDAIQQASLASQDALDGFKLQARELRRRRAAELRRNHRTAPYNNTHTTFIKATATPHTTTCETTTTTTTTTTTPPSSFGSDLPNHPASDTTHAAKPLFQLKRSNPFANQSNHRAAPVTETHFLSKKAGPLLESVNAHVPLLQPHDAGNKVTAELGSLEDQLQKILGASPQPPPPPCEQQVHGKANHIMDHPQRRASHVVEQGSSAAAAVGGLAVQLGAIVKSLQAKQVAEQEFRDKMLVFVECMVVSLNTMAQARSTN